MPADVDARPQKVVYSFSCFPSVGLVVAHGDDFVLTIAARCLDDRHVTLLLADEGTGDGRTHRYAPLFDVGHKNTDEQKTHQDARQHHKENHCGTEHHLAVGIQTCDVDDLRVGEFRLDFGNAALDEALLLFGGMVFGVLLQIAVRTRLGDRIDDARPRYRFEPLQFFTQALRARCRERYFCHYANTKSNSSSDRTSPAPRYGSAKPVASAPAMVVV